MILVDFSHLSHRNLFVSKAAGNTAKDYQAFYYHNMYQSIGYLKKKFKAKGEQVVLCIDSRHNWRKDEYDLYKANRKAGRKKDDFNWDEFFQVQTELIESFKELTKFHVLEIDKAEGDDILYVISEYLSKGVEFHTGTMEEGIIVVTSDKDLQQISRFDNVRMFDPMKSKFIEDFTENMLLNHILIGDASDNIPSFKAETEFTEEFISHLRDNGIFFTDVKTVQDLELFESIRKDWLSDPIANGLIYKLARFGPKTADKLILSGKLEETLKDPLLKANFERNKKLIDLRHIPEDIKVSIKEEFDIITTQRKTLPLFGLQNFLVKHGMIKIQKRMADFLT